MAGVKRTLAWLFLLTLLSLTTACASLQEAVKAPQIKLASVNLAEVGPTEQTFVLGFAVDNPNPIPIPVSAINYAVNLAGTRFASGESAQSFTLPANGQGDIQIKVNTDLIRSAQTLSRIVLAGGQRELDYDISGDLKVNLPFAKALPFTHTGKVLLER